MTRGLSAWIWAAAALAWGSAAEAATWTVRQDGSGDFTTIQAAVDAAQPGDEVLVGPGTYRDLHPDSRGKTVVVELRSGISIRSMEGASGTIIDATSEGERHAVTGYDADPASLLEGFTIRGGDAPVGAGIFLLRCDSAILRNRIVDNISGAGGGIACDGASAPRIESNAILDNYACCGEGGGVLLIGGSSARVIGNEVRRNQGFGGGGIGMSQAGTPEVIDNLVVGNIGLAGGGIASIGSGGRIERNRVFENSADQGGGMAAWSGGGALFSHNLVARNTAMGDGGGYHISADAPHLLNETIVANVSTIGAGVFSWNGSSARIERSIVAFGVDGEGIYAEDPSSVPTVLCCDVYGNTFGEYGGFIADQTGTNGNLSLDPRFCDLDGGDYRLAAGSPLRIAPSSLGGGCGMRGALAESCGGRGAGAIAGRAHAAPFPNPSRGVLWIPAEHAGADGIIRVVDLAGRRVRELRADRTAPAHWDGRDHEGRAVSTGIYFVLPPSGGEPSRVIVIRR